MRRLDCPAGGWIGLPDEWLGAHALKQDDAKRRAQEAGLSETFQTWAIALSLLEDWGDIPGLSGNPDKWDLSQKSWPVLNWISNEVITDLTMALRFPKVLPAASPDGSVTPTETTETMPAGS